MIFLLFLILSQVPWQLDWNYNVQETESTSMNKNVQETEIVKNLFWTVLSLENRQNNKHEFCLHSRIIDCDKVWAYSPLGTCRYCIS